MMAKAVKADEPTGVPENPVPTVEEPTPTPDDPSKEAQSAELAEKLKSMESELGRFKQELGDERKKSEELNAYKLHYEQTQQQKQNEPQKQPTIDELNTQFFDNPTQVLNQREMGMAYNTARAQAPVALAMAKIQNPEAFNGISDEEVRQGMEGGVRSGTTNPMLLGDPNAYIGLAWILRGQQTGFKIPTASPGGMNPTETEKPGGKPLSEEDEVPDLAGDSLTERLVQRIMRDGKISKEEAIKKVHENKDKGSR